MKNIQRHLDITRRNSEWYLQKQRAAQKAKEEKNGNKS